MTNQLTRRVLGAGFAAALLLGGAAACGDDDAGSDGDTLESDGIDTGEGLGGTDDQGDPEDSGVVDGMGGTDDEE